MQKITADSPEAKSADIVAENIARLKALFPEAFAEDGIDFEVLKQLLGGAVNEKEEKYSFTWPGKRQARQIALTPSLGTLRPAPEESVNWDTTQNLFIEGDNLEVLKLLQKSYSGKVKMIYIDPPYNTGSNFVYKDDYKYSIKNYKLITGQIDEGGKSFTSNTETSGRYHSNWLNMIFPRLRLAKNLLRDDGVLFISIDDNEVHSLRKVCDEIFGEENFLATVIWQKVYSPKNSAKHFSEDHDFVVVYARNAEIWRPHLLPRTEEMTARYGNPDNDPRGPWKPGDLSARNYYGQGTYAITCPSGREITGPPTGLYWRVSKEKFLEMNADGRIWWGEKGDNIPAIKRFLSEVQDGVVPQTLWLYREVGHTQEAKKELLATLSFSSSDEVFETPKPTRLIQKMLLLATSPNESDLVLDFFSGSGTTAHAVMTLNKEDNSNRRFIMVQLPELTSSKDYPTIAEIGKERIRRVIKKIKADHPDHTGDLGFRVFKLDSSNIRPWNPDANDVAGSLLAYTDNLLPDRTEQDLLYEVLLKFGLDLTSPMQGRAFAGHTVYSMGQGVLFACLSKAIAPADIEPIGLGIADWRKEANPVGESTVIFRDSAFAGDVAKANMTAILQQHGIDNVRSL